MTRIRLIESELINLLEEILLVEAMSLEQVYATHYSKGTRKEIPEEDFYKIAEADPTRQGDTMGNYTDWMIRLYRKGKLKMEDLYKATEYLTAFHKFKNRIEKKDIGQYKSLPDLYNVVKQFLDNPDQATSKSDEIRKIKEGAEKVYEDEEWLIIVPHTEEAAIEYGKNTQWCTAATKSSNYFSQYMDDYGDGCLFINIDKQNNSKYQFCFDSDEFMDATDEQIDCPIKDNIGLTDGVIDFYRKKRGESDAKKLTSKYGPNNLDRIVGLEDCFVHKEYFYWNENRQLKTELVKYNRDTDEYEVVGRYRQYGGYNYSCLLIDGRFLVMKDDRGYQHKDILDLKTKKLLGIENPCSMWAGIKDYIMFCPSRGDHCMYAYSLKEMKVTGKLPCSRANHVPYYCSKYKTSLFIVKHQGEDGKIAVYDAEAGKLITPFIYDSAHVIIDNNAARNQNRILLATNDEENNVFLTPDGQIYHTTCTLEDAGRYMNKNGDKFNGYLIWI